MHATMVMILTIVSSLMTLATMLLEDGREETLSIALEGLERLTPIHWPARVIRSRYVMAHKEKVHQGIIVIGEWDLTVMKAVLIVASLVPPAVS